MRLAALAIIAVLLPVSALPTSALAAKAADYETLIESIGAKITKAPAKSVLFVEIVMDKNQAIAAIPRLKTMGLIASDISEYDINLHPYTLCMTVSLEAAALELQAAYRDPTVNRIKAIVSLDEPDKGGKTRQNLMYTFNFSRDHFKRVDWQHFALGSFPQVAPDFALSPWLKARLAEEN